ncbi:MAG: hypothetical protein J6X87_00360 [Clostridia bacterium]|nr:hypothetical protein [Clostridia bacterium]
MAKTKTGSNFARMLSVLLGVLGAGCLFSNGWKGVFDYVSGYSFKTNFFSYFFGPALFPVVTLAAALLFFIVSLRDLEPMVGGFSIFTAILAAFAAVAYAVFFINNIRAVETAFSPAYIMHFGKFLLLVAYFLFAMYCRNRGGIRNVAWGFAIAALVVILAATVYGFVKETLYAREFVDNIFTILAHAAMFFCGLRQY